MLHPTGQLILLTGTTGYVGGRLLPLIRSHQAFRLEEIPQASDAAQDSETLQRELATP